MTKHKVFLVLQVMVGWGPEMRPRPSGDAYRITDGGAPRFNRPAP